ncbi:MAG: two-component system response regulator [Alicyclobacillus sp. RIFOXYA1_FULL_53_8]|nr:MAG: two-component system response regulator [Alicyclobacillus sp. RIFOXYA1_FULL_53_8]
MAKILVTDDAAFMRMMLKNILESAGHEVVEAGNGLEAIQQYEAQKPDAVTMDITMPEMEGIPAVREIIKRDPNARIVMCTAMGQQSMVVDAIQSGARGFIVKPFQKDKVLDEITKLLG